MKRLSKPIASGMSLLTIVAVYFSVAASASAQEQEKKPNILVI